MLRDHLPENRRPDEMLYTCNIMTYELGGLVRQLIYARHASEGKDGASSAAYTRLARLDLADLITQCRLMAEQMGWDWPELMADGEERFVERMKELREGVI